VRAQTRASFRSAAIASVVLSACRVEVGPPHRGENSEAGGKPSGKVTIYTSMYRELIDGLDPVLVRRLPGVSVEWLQGGSEKLATRVDAEIMAGAPGADIVMTSDPLWYERLCREGHLLPYASIRALPIPRELLDEGGCYVTARISTMVVAYDERLVPEGEAPRTFAELFTDRWKGKVTMPDPLGSGTTFTTLAFLVGREGPGIIERMKAAGAIASGGNSTALVRIESGEHQVGFVLLENVLAAAKKGSPVRFRIPDEGAVIVPGPIAILARGPNPAAARAVYDVLLSEEAQRVIVGGSMHSPYRAVPPPEGAPPLERLLETQYRWTEAFVETAVNDGAALRKRFAEVMGGS
jgi:iron(III) transport system substrate-binding protein